MADNWQSLWRRYVNPVTPAVNPITGLPAFVPLSGTPGLSELAPYPEQPEYKDDESDEKDSAENKSENRTGEGGHDTGGQPKESDRLHAYDPEYWGEQEWAPDYGWSDALKELGFAKAAMRSFKPGLSMLGFLNPQSLMDPLRDPVNIAGMQQLASKYGVTEAQLQQAVKDAYGIEPTKLGLLGSIFSATPAVINANDTFRGVMMGANDLGVGALNDQWGDLSSIDMEAYELAQIYDGMTKMGMNPYGTGMTDYSGVFSDFLNQDALGTLQDYGYTGAYAASPMRQYIARGVERGEFAPDGPAAQAAARTDAREKQRQASREWANETLAGKTTDTFGDWQASRSGDGNDGGGISDHDRADAECDEGW